MKKFFNLLFKFSFVFGILLLFGEGYFRFQHTSPNEELRYKKIHCLKDWSEIRLCPKVKEGFTRRDGKPWDIQTNETGERITNSNLPEKNETVVWLLGDSMAMGYGLPTKKTIAFLLETKYKIKTRVIAVDAIGTNGISNLYMDTLIQTNKNPNSIYWIWNPSDFIDDEREKKRMKKYVYPIHFFLSRNSSLYESLLPSPQTNVYINGIPTIYPKTHPTYSFLKTFIHNKIHNKEQWKILFSWGMAPNGTPDTNDPNYDVAKKFFETEGISTIDLRQETEVLFAQKKQIYIPNDGHPDEDLAKLFAEAIANDYKKTQ
ncbi:LA_2486 family SGNH/GDSL-type esterase [Leptospira levettii]|uniref:LA_2486 family SGNH/GDSL-type esterase n=1 Tax=Leptospira levettii TaxID=2023178 RepID=UPI001AF003B5|nr:hypothetical protein [Leptospira levettii]